LEIGSKRPQARRRKPATKLDLQVLEDRTMPSAAVVETPPLFAALEQQAVGVIVRLENALNGIAMTAVQEFAQEEASIAGEEAQVVQQWANLFKDIFGPQNTPSIPPTPSAGSGSGSGATTTAHEPIPTKGIGQTNAPDTGSGSAVVQFGSANEMAYEMGSMCGSGNVTIPVDRQGNPNTTVSVNYATSNGTATAGLDYTAESGTVTFAPGQTINDITIPILDIDDSGGTKNFYVTLSDPVNAVLGPVNPCDVTIDLDPQQKPTDTLRWNPCDGNNASTVQNWYDVTQKFQLPADALGPTTSSPIQFDANPGDTPNSDAPITWNQSYTVASISIQGGYNAVQTVNYGAVLEMNGANGTTLTVDASSTGDFDLEGNNNLQTDAGVAEIDGTMYVNFLAAGTVRTINGGTVNENGDVDFGENGKVNIINSGTLNLNAPAGKDQSSGSPINVTSGTLNFGDNKNSKNYATFHLTTASADIKISGGGTMNVYQTGGTPIDNVLGGAGAVITNSGTVNLQGVAGAGGTTIAAPLQNDGTLKVLGGDWTFSQKDATGNDLSMAQGSITLTNSAKIYCSHGFTQSGGAFNINTAQATLAVTGVPANFNGGAVSFSLPNGVLNTGGIAFNGATLNMNITGGSNTSNVINSTSCSIKAGTSTINVTRNGGSGAGLWTLIKNPAGTNIVGDFNTVNLPEGVVEEPVTNTWSCSDS
jgi:hypothetical protein